MRPTLIIFGVFVIAAVTLTTARPHDFHLGRSIDVAAPPEIIERQVSDLRRWTRWSPYDRADPHLQREYSEPATSYRWSGNDSVGAGQLTVARVTPGKVVIVLMLIDRPVTLASVATFAIVPQYDGVTRVTWSLDGEASLVNRLLMGLGVLQHHYDAKLAAGLIMLKAAAEAEASAQQRVGSR